jgi:hypothetical protein
MKFSFKKYNLILLVLTFLYLGLGFAINKSMAASTYDEKNGFCEYTYSEVDGKKDKEFLDKIEIDTSLIATDGIIIGVKDMNSCPLPGKNTTGMGVVGADYLFSSIICVVQAVISDAMFKVYCSILYWAKDVVAAAMVLYIMLYGLAIMFDLGNNPARNAPKNFIKIVIIYILATNATIAYSWLYKSFFVTINDFSSILAKDAIYDDEGQPVYNIDGKLLLKDGRIFKDPALQSSTDVAYINNPYNVRVPKQQYYYDAAAKEYKPVFFEKESCPEIQAEWTRRGLKDKDRQDLKAEDFFDCSAPKSRFVDVFTSADNKPVRFYKVGTTSGCNMSTEAEKCRTAFNGVIGKFDAMFKNIVGDSKGAGVTGLLTALIGVGAGGGPVLALILLSGVLAMLFAFFNLVFAFITALMGLTFLFMLAPVFMPMALFTATFDYFKRWLSSIISFVLQPILVLAFLSLLGSMVGSFRIFDLMKEVEEKRLEERFAGLTFESIGSAFKEPKFLIPANDKYFDNINKGNPDTSQKLISLTELQKWRQTKISELKLKYFIETYVHSIVSDVAILDFGYLPNMNPFDDDKNEKPNPTAEDRYMVYQADGRPITINNIKYNTIYSSTDGKESYSKKRAADYILLQIDNDDQFETTLKNKGFDAVLTEFPDFNNNFYNNALTHNVCDQNRVIRCVENCPEKASGGPSATPLVPADNNSTPVKPSLPAVSCNGDKNTAKEISVFETDPKITKNCAKNCSGLDPEKWSKKVFLDLVLFIILNIVTAAFVSMIPQMCKKLSHWSSGGGGATPAIFGGSKRYMAEAEYSHGEKSEVYHAGAIVETGLDGSRPGLVFGAIDKIASVASGTNVSFLKELFDGGILGYEKKIKAETSQKVNAAFGKEFEEATKSLSSEDQQIIQLGQQALQKESQAAGKQPDDLYKQEVDKAIKEAINKGLYTNVQTTTDEAIDLMLERLRELGNIEKSKQQSGSR